MLFNYVYKMYEVTTEPVPVPYFYPYKAVKQTAMVITNQSRLRICEDLIFNLKKS